MGSAIKRILVIKHGAFGDVIKALGVLKAIRDHYKGVHIDCLTTPAYAPFILQTELVDDVVLDPRSKNVFRTLKLLNDIRHRGYDLIIDLQNSKRTNGYATYYKLLGGKAPWSGTARMCAYGYPMAWKSFKPLYERFAYQLEQLGIEKTTEDLLPGLSWIKPQTFPFELPESFAIIIPGSSPKALEKRWPVQYYAQLAKRMVDRGITPVLVGGPDEVVLMPEIIRLCPDALNTAGRLTLLQIAYMAQNAKFIVGNDTGPLYLCQAAGRPTCVLWSNHSDPKIHAPQGGADRQVKVLQRDALETLSVDEVWHALQGWIK